ncbi:hypothetical protein RR48_08904 [Papilio machaon]|uniref:Uncharacterized protein n=1 Tax=Papilio machaon TaxID=76193 RepID=A0A194QV92_PAPMA|nr:hypothetical protein RR48_08904 [Papilio machaon]
MAGRAVLFAFLTLVAYSTADVQNDLTRIKRSPHYCDYPPPPPPITPPPPPPPPPQKPPRFFWYHESPIMPAFPRHAPLQWQAFIQPQHTNERHIQNEAQNSQSDVGFDKSQFGNNEEPPCEKCGKKNTAVSNAQSETGDAVAIAISKGSNQ